jgi:hypothetical protein
MFARYRNGGSYSSWNEILTSATSVNADTLDNVNSTSFLRSDESDTMTGQLEISHNAENHLNINSSTTAGAIHFRESGTLRGIFGFTNGSAIYSNSGDNDMVWRAEANAHIVSNTSTHGLSIVSGNVGIGTTSPQAKLDVMESIRISRTATYTSHWKQFISHTGTSNYGTLYFDSNSSTGDFVIRPNLSEKFRVKANGEVTASYGRLSSVEYNGSDVDKVNFALSGSTLTITTS